jgi:hypothetical protein
VIFDIVLPVKMGEMEIKKRHDTFQAKDFSLSFLCLVIAYADIKSFLQF